LRSEALTAAAAANGGGSGDLATSITCTNSRKLGQLNKQQQQQLQQQQLNLASQMMRTGMI